MLPLPGYALFRRGPHVQPLFSWTGSQKEKFESLTALRGTGSEKVQVLSYAYYLAFTATANDPVPPSRDRMLRRGCDGARAEKGSLNLADDTAKREIEAKMEALPIGKPWFGPVVAQDENGCYHIILYKHPDYLGVEHREALLTIITYVKRRQVTYTRAMPYFSAWLPTFVKMVSRSAWRTSSPEVWGTRRYDGKPSNSWDG